MQNTPQPRLSAANLVKKLHDLASESSKYDSRILHVVFFYCIFLRNSPELYHMAVQKKGYTELQETLQADSISWSYGSSLQKDTSCTVPCSWSTADPSAFLIRGENYLKDNRKVFFDSSYQCYVPYKQNLFISVA